MNTYVVQRFITSALMIIALLAFFSNVGMTDDQKQFPPARVVPGLTSEDKFPNGCVDCHINMPEINQDERISTLLSKWTGNVEKKLLEKAQSAAPDIKLKGEHPPATESLGNIPSACVNCHSRTPNTAPPFAALLHLIHLTGGDENHFMTIFQGECTHCHKMNAATGRWVIPSRPEK